MHAARGKAIETGQVRYSTEKPCRRGHYAERYTTNGGCVQCVSDAARKTQEKINAAVKAGQHHVALRLIRQERADKVLKAGGPETEAEARELKIDWFKCPDQPRGCLGIIYVGTDECNQCGRGVLSKEALDLLG